MSNVLPVFLVSQGSRLDAWPPRFSDARVFGKMRQVDPRPAAFTIPASLPEFAAAIAACAMHRGGTDPLLLIPYPSATDFPDYARDIAAAAAFARAGGVVAMTDGHGRMTGECVTMPDSFLAFARTVDDGLSEFAERMAGTAFAHGDGAPVTFYRAGGQTLARSLGMGHAHTFPHLTRIGAAMYSPWRTYDISKSFYSGGRR